MSRCRRRCAASSRPPQRCTGWSSRGSPATPAWRSRRRFRRRCSPSRRCSRDATSTVGGLIRVDGGRDDDLDGAGLRGSGRHDRRRRLLLDGSQGVAVAVVAEGAEQRNGEHHRQGDGAHAEQAGVDRAERTESFGDRRGRIDPHRRTVVEVFERLLAAHDVMGPGALRSTSADPFDLRRAIGIDARAVPEGVVVVEVVAHRRVCWSEGSKASSSSK